jgi:hypothetical protein
MKFARIVFRIAGIWGVLLLGALYFVDTSHVSTPAAAQFYFGFLAVTMAWQIAFLMIASDPVRFRPLMIPAILEKFFYIVTIVVLYLGRRVGTAELLTIVPDSVLGGLFVVALVRTPGGQEEGRGERKGKV